ncbi:nuclear transport factor 2 family protein [Actinosynnema sp. NPDC020468]|uniref:nuclear transport factor 2 family protein n=1 Tax=Actinosynnema sp. NPDC020468 TaxID=3154488 RepID=UPI0033E96FD9
MTAFDVVRAHYEASERGDLDGMLAPIGPETTWTEAAGATMGGTYTGLDEIKEKVFFRIGAEWDGFGATVSDLIDGGDTVVALGHYSGTNKATGKSIHVRFAHIWRVEGDTATSFEQIADTALLRAAEPA